MTPGRRYWFAYRVPSDPTLSPMSAVPPPPAAPAPVSAPTHRALFAKNFFRHPRMLGSIVPSSRFLIRRLLDEADWSRARTVVEYGPGVGTITRAILDRMRPDARLVVFETNPDFVHVLRSTFPDPRLDVVEGSAADVEEALAVRGIVGADVAVSGIPFSTMPPAVRTSIVSATCRVLRPDGTFMVYQFSLAVLPDLKRAFSVVRRRFEPLNVPPVLLFYCTR